MRSDYKTVIAAALAIFLVSCAFPPATAGGRVEAWAAASGEIDWAMLGFRAVLIAALAAALCLWADDPSPAPAEKRVQ